MSSIQDRLRTKLENREVNNYLRKLPLQPDLTDFCSNDYLGLARHPKLKQQVHKGLDPDEMLGSTGSRLLTGNSEFAEQLEEYLANIFEGEAALLFNSGYAANLAVTSAIPQSGDTILIDELSHACIREGSRLSPAPRQMFRHNDLEDLRAKLKNSTGEKFVVAEAVYSMDGDQAPLEGLTRLCEQYNANLILDEAHSTGVYGKRGSGLACELGLQDQFFARVYTFGKAMGGHGACVVGSKILKQYLVNYARPFIFTTAMPYHSLVSIKEAFQFLADNPGLQDQLHENIGLFRNLVSKIPLPDRFLESRSAVHAMVVPGNAEAKEASARLMDKGFDIRPILYPSVPLGKERLRISLHSFNSASEIESLGKELAKI